MANLAPPPQTFSRDEQYRLKRRVTIVGAIVNLLLAIVKIVVGIVGQSQALVADGVHSLSDLISDAFVLIAARFGSLKPDANHPYGHERIETAATIVVGVLLVAVALGFTYDAALRLLNPDRLMIPTWIVLPTAIAAVLAKEAVYQYTVRAGRRVRSPLIEANAWHHRSDALSSVVVIVGVTGAYLGFLWLDAVATVVVALMVGLMGWRFTWQAVRELVDTGLEDSDIAKLQAEIDAVDGVIEHHSLRTRCMGGNVLVDVHVRVAPWVSVSEGHRIAEQVKKRLLGHHDSTSDVLVHIDAEADAAHSAASAKLPLRAAVLSDLRRVGHDIPELAAVAEVTLHYLNGRVHLDLILPPERLPPERLPLLSERLEAAAAPLGYIGDIRVLLGYPRSQRLH
ncbi:hypothetical protein CAI21_19775 [Alkalilimnicola ehrlichii]|nr:hypothetical protein CAI21_19775 [Alkalilimnicola ehrlichii]